MRRSFLLAAMGLMIWIVTVETKTVEAGGFQRAYGRGYYANYYGGYGGTGPYTTGYRGTSPEYGYSSSGWGYGTGYGGWSTPSAPFHHGSMYSGGYRPSYSYGLYNSAGYAYPVTYQPSYAPYGYSTARGGYDYAPYVADPMSTINIAPTYSARYGEFGYHSVGCCGR